MQIPIKDSKPPINNRSYHPKSIGDSSCLVFFVIYQLESRDFKLIIFASNVATECQKIIRIFAILMVASLLEGS